MSQHIEIEFKTMLTEAEFNELHKNMPFPKQPFVQINHYFETDNFALKSKNSAIRIREKDDQYILTLKEPHEEGLLETNELLAEDVAKSWLESNPISVKNVTERLEHLGIHEKDLRYFGSLTTERYTYEENSIHYMLDKSFYHNVVDYELEIEAPSKAKGLQALKKVLQQHNLVERKAEPKIARFFREALHKED